MPTVAPGMGSTVEIDALTHGLSGQSERVQDDGTSHGPIDDRFVPEGLEELAFEVLGARQRGEPPAAIAQVLMEEHRLGAMNAYKLLRSIGLTDEAAQSAINEATRPADDA